MIDKMRMVASYKNKLIQFQFFKPSVRFQIRPSREIKSLKTIHFQSRTGISKLRFENDSLCFQNKVRVSKEELKAGLGSQMMI